MVGNTVPDLDAKQERQYPVEQVGDYESFQTAHLAYLLLETVPVLSLAPRGVAVPLVVTFLGLCFETIKLYEL